MEKSVTIPLTPTGTESIRFAESPQVKIQRWQASSESVIQCQNYHDVHINSYHMFETCIREGACPHPRMPASSRLDRRHHHLSSVSN